MKTFNIIANVTFAIPSPMRSSFNTHHKSRLEKESSGVGKVTEEGAKFFGKRERLTHEAMAESFKAMGYTFLNNWYYKNGVPFQAGSGTEGRSLFAWALSELTQQAQAIAAKEKAKTEKAKVEKPVKTAKAKPATKPATIAAKPASELVNAS